MNHSSLRKFAMEARRELLERIEFSARKYGITKEELDQGTIVNSKQFFIHGKPLENEEIKQRNHVIQRMETFGFERILEEISFTWFNRLIALRFMEVNDYLPTRVRVLSSEEGLGIEPDMMKEAFTLDLDLDFDYIYELKQNHQTDELFRYLIFAHCKDLSEVMPFMFDVNVNTMLLFPEGLLQRDSFLQKLIDPRIIPEEDWKHVEIIGWLYQYYIAEENERVISQKGRYKNEDIPFATQLFTPEWIVRYMVQNTLGRYWIEAHPEHEDLKENWEFYLENQNVQIKKSLPTERIIIEELKCFDPAMGSGHILVYMFDVLFQIYQKCGYVEEEIPRLILENNLYGLDIDDRAYQLASFALMMKALQYNPYFLNSVRQEGLRMNLCAIQESNSMTYEEISRLAGETAGDRFGPMKEFIDQFQDAKTIGSLLSVSSYDYEFLTERINALKDEESSLFHRCSNEELIKTLRTFMKQAELMRRTYDILVTNPPYIGRRYLNRTITTYLDQYYPHGKSDLFAAFIEYSFTRTKEKGQIGFMTPFVWMFLQSYEKLRKKIIHECTISSLIQLEYSGFDGATVPICTFTLSNKASELSGEYIRLSDFKGAKNQPIKTKKAVQNPTVSYRYTVQQERFLKVPGIPIAYWVPKSLLNLFHEVKNFRTYIDVTGSQNITANNNRYLRMFWEVDPKKIKKRWVFYAKGGPFRKWYGNIVEVVDWSEEARTFYRENKTSNLLPEQYWFRKGITYNGITSKGFSARIVSDVIYDKKGPTFHILDETLELYFLGMLNTKAIDFIMNMLNPTISYQMRDVNNLPVKFPEDKNQFKRIKELTKENIHLSKADWNSFETSFQFTKHPFLKHPAQTVEASFQKWEQETSERFQRLKANEEELNEIFLKLYGLDKVLAPDVEESDVTVHKADIRRDVKSFLSYAVGCMFGRYSLDKEGLIQEVQKLNEEQTMSFRIVTSNFIPVVDRGMFDDDIIHLLIQFLNETYGEDSLEENLMFLAKGIGKRANETSREALRRYFLTPTQFFADHLRMYKRKPIYWMLTSGPERAFNGYFYIHRYDPTLISVIRTTYVHEVQRQYETERNDYQHLFEETSSQTERRKIKRTIATLDRKVAELKNYDEKLRHYADLQIEIDSDEGVQKNYRILQDLLAKL